MMVQIVDATQGGDANIVTAGMTISQYEQLAARVAAIDADMPPELVTKPLDTVIDDSVAQVFDAMDNPADGPVDALIAQANTGALHEAVYQRLSDVVWEAVGSDERLSAIADEYGDTMLRVLADAAVAQPLRERLTQGGAGSSWVDSAVKRAVLNRRTHAIAENASDAQARAAQAAGQADALRNEVPARQQAIADSKAALERNPHDAGLAADLAHLEDQLHDLVAREMAAAEEAGAAEREREATQGALDQAREDAANADRQEQQEAERVFHGD
jgi:hypothetical protein